MLPTNLTTNEVRNSAGTEVEFIRLDSDGRSVEFALSGELPYLEHRVRLAHNVTGTGLKKTRSSRLGVHKESISAVDNVSTVRTEAYVVLRAQVGALTTDAEMKTVLAELGSLLSGNGTADLLKYDGTGTGSAALISGSL